MCKRFTTIEAVVFRRRDGEKPFIYVSILNVQVETAGGEVQEVDHVISALPSHGKLCSSLGGKENGWYVAFLSARPLIPPDLLTSQRL